MKFKHLFLAAFAAVFSLTACEEKEDDLGAAEVTVDVATLSFDKGEGSESVTFTATRDWTAKAPEWIALSASNGKASTSKQTLVISVEENKGNDRSGDVVISIGLSKATITVTQKGDKGEYVVEEGDGSKDKPFSVAQACDAVKDLTWTDKDTYDKAGPYYIRGKISAITEAYSAQYGNGNFNISDDGTSAGDQLICYRIYYLENKKWADGNTQIQVGDEVIVYGELMNYSNSKPEMVQKGSYLYSLNGETVATGGQEVDHNNDPAKTVAEFIAAADTKNYYKLTGKVSSFNATYCSFDLTDDTGKIYVYSVANKDSWSSKIKNGATVTLSGQYKKYDDKDEVVNAYILSVEGGQDTDYNNAPAITVAEFIAAADKTTYYKLTGTVGGSINTQYGNFDLTDATGTIYVYGTTNISSYASKLVDGATVTLAAVYDYYEKNSKHEAVNAYILSCEGGTPPTEDTPSGSGTLSDPYNPKAAYDAAAALGSGEKSGEVYIAGKISSIKYTFSAQYGTATFNISEDGTTSGTQLPCYSVYYLGNRAWVDGDTQVKEGDEVIIYGKLTNYQGNTPETSSKEAYIYSLNGVTDGEPSDVFGVASTTVSVGAAATSATVKVTGNVAWTASSENARISPESGEGAADITVSFDANTDTENEKTYTVVVSTNANVETKSFTVTITQGKASSGEGNTITIALNNETSFAESNGGDTLKNGWAATVDGFKVATYKYKSTSNPVTPDQYSMRVYKSAVFFIEAPAGKTITALTFKANNYDNGKYILDLTGVEGTEGTAVADKSAETISWTGNASTVILQAAAGQTRLESVEVVFE